MTNTSNASNDWVQEEVTNEEVITCTTDQNYSNKVKITETNTLAPERNKDKVLFTDDAHILVWNEEKKKWEIKEKTKQ